MKASALQAPIILRPSAQTGTDDEWRRADSGLVAVYDVAERRESNMLCRYIRLDFERFPGAHPCLYDRTLTNSPKYLARFVQLLYRRQETQRSTSMHVLGFNVTHGYGTRNTSSRLR